MNTRYLVGLFFILVFTDGALRKWVWPGYGIELFFAKDVILLVALLAYLFRQKWRVPLSRQNRALLFLASCYMGMTVIQTFNPRLPSLTVGLLGLKSHVAYLALLVLVPATFPRQMQSQAKLLGIYIVCLGVPILMLGIYQYFQPTAHWVNRYVREDVGISVAGFTYMPRVTGSFSYITGMTTFLSFNLSLAIGLIIGGIRYRGWLLYVGLSLFLLSMIVGPMNGSRAFVVYPLIGLPLVSWLVVRRGLFRGRLVLAIAVIGVGASVLLSTWAVSGWKSLGERTETARDERQRVVSATAGAIQRMAIAGPWGYGAGATHQAAPRLVSEAVRYAWLPDIYFEEENGRVGVELGWIGFLCYLALKLVAVGTSYQVFKQAESRADLVAGATGLLFLSAHLVGGIVFNPIAGACFWGVTGVVAYLRSQQVHRVVGNRERARGRGISR